MNCPECGAETIVSDSRVRTDGATTRRRRVCVAEACEHRFSTWEVAVAAYDDEDPRQRVSAALRLYGRLRSLSAEDRAVLFAVINRFTGAEAEDQELMT